VFIHSCRETVSQFFDRKTCRAKFAERFIKRANRKSEEVVKDILYQAVSITDNCVCFSEPR
jgi:hypothetical protein